MEERDEETQGRKEEEDVQEAQEVMKGRSGDELGGQKEGKGIDARTERRVRVRRDQREEGI